MANAGLPRIARAMCRDERHLPCVRGTGAGTTTRGSSDRASAASAFSRVTAGANGERGTPEGGSVGFVLMYVLSQDLYRIPRGGTRTVPGLWLVMGLIPIFAASYGRNGLRQDNGGHGGTTGTGGSKTVTIPTRSSAKGSAAPVLRTTYQSHARAVIEASATN